MKNALVLMALTSVGCDRNDVLWPPEAPADLQGVSTDEGIHLSWLDMSDDEDVFSVDRRNGLTFEPVARLPANATEYDDTGLELGVTYTYQVRSINDDGSSESNPVTVVFGED